jgi:small-conductance mechanosensitive channel
MSVRRVLAAALLLMSPAMPSARADDASPASAITARSDVLPSRPTISAQHRARTNLGDRIATYTRELNLDAKQQSQLRALLLQQREQVLRVWNDTSIPAVQRVHATRAISEATADGIRAMLTEEQRKKYNPPRPARDSTAQPGAPSAADWINAANSR